MEDETKQFTVKPAVAAMSGVIIVILGIMLSLDKVTNYLLYSVFFSSISLPALTALPMLDSYRKDNKIINAAFGFASLLGFGGFFLFIATLIFNFSNLSGFVFLISGIVWVTILLKFKSETKNDENS